MPSDVPDDQLSGVHIGKEMNGYAGIGRPSTQRHMCLENLPVNGVQSGTPIGAERGPPFPTV